MKRFKKIISLVLIFVVLASGMIFAVTKTETNESETSVTTKLAIDCVAVIMATGDIMEIKATASPNQKLIWSSSDESAATVENGKVTAHKIGRCKITVTDGSSKESITCEVIIVPNMTKTNFLKFFGLFDNDLRVFLNICRIADLFFSFR